MYMINEILTICEINSKTLLEAYSMITKSILKTQMTFL